MRHPDKWLIDSLRKQVAELKKERDEAIARAEVAEARIEALLKMKDVSDE